MENWRKYRNYRKTENADGSFTYVVMVDGVKVEVSAEIYREYASTGRKMEYMEFELKRDRVARGRNGKVIKDKNGLPVVLPEHEVSLDKLMREDWDFPTSSASLEEAVIQNLEIEGLHRCIALLSDDERALLNALFFDELTEREYAAKMALSKTAIHARKMKLLAKLKKLLDL